MENLGLVGFTGAGANRLFSALTGLAGAERVRGRGRHRHRSRRAPRRGSRSCRSRRRSCRPASSSCTSRCRRARSPAKGLGAKFLGALRNCDAILIVLRAFADGGVDPDPDGDLAAIELELVMADLDSVEQRLERQRKGLKSPDKAAAAAAQAEVGALERAHAALSDGTPLARAGLDRGRARAARAVVPAHDEADARRVQHGRGGRRQRWHRSRARSRCRSTSKPRSPRASPTIAPRCARCTASASRRSTRSRTASYHLLGRRTFLTTGDKESRARGRSAPAPRRPSARA